MIYLPTGFVKNTLCTYIIDYDIFIVKLKSPVIVFCALGVEEIKHKVNAKSTFLLTKNGFWFSIVIDEEKKVL